MRMNPSAIIRHHITAWLMAGGAFAPYDATNALAWLNRRRVSRGEPLLTSLPSAHA